MSEERGYESIWFTEHTHIPVSRETPYPAGGDLPDFYSHIYDPFVALAFAAAATERIKIGTGVCLVIEHDPIVLAKVVASLDRLSGGRFLFGIGAGWNREEMANHGTDPSRRFRLMRERVAAQAGPAARPADLRRRRRRQGARPRAALRRRVDPQPDPERGVAQGADRR